MNDLPGQANGYGQPGSDHASSRTEPDNAERLTGIYDLITSGWSAEPSVDSLDAVRADTQG